jgi:hypothetical protein
MHLLKLSKKNNKRKQKKNNHSKMKNKLRKWLNKKTVQKDLVDKLSRDCVEKMKITCAMAMVHVKRQPKEIKITRYVSANRLLTYNHFV